MYSKDTKYNVKYVTKDGKEETKQITPEEDMSKPQMIMKLKEEDKNFFKLIENVEYITPEELKKLHKDYKSTVGDIIRFSKYRGQDPEKVRQKYKDLGYDETDPMIVTSDGKGGTILKPVKVKKEENKMSKTLFDYLEEHSFEGVDIRDTVYDMTCWFEFTLEDADSDPFDMFMSKLAKSLHIDFEDVNKTVVVDLTNWVTKNYNKLEEIFDLSGEDKESNIEEIVGSIMPGLLSGYTTNSVYKELADNMIVESKEVVEENEDEFEELENLDEEVTDVEEEKEETLDESIKPEEDNGDYNYFYSPRQIIEICEDKKYEHTFDEEFGTIEELEKELQDIKRIESEKPITTIEEPLTDRYPGWKNCKVKTILKDGREFVSEEDTLSVWSAVQLVVADEVMKESRKPLSEEVEKEETLDENKIVENNSSLDGEDLTNTFKNYKAFEANFGPIKIVKNSYDKNYKVYKVNEEDAGNYIYYSNDKDNIEGWLYGAVQAANGKFNKLKNKNETVNKSIINEEDEETLDESLKPENDNGDYKYFYSPQQIIEICEDRKYEHAFDEESGTIEELEKELQDVKRIESEKPITGITLPMTNTYPGWKNCKVKTILKDGREFVSEEKELSVWDVVQLVMADEVMKESRKPLSEEVEKEETLDEAIKRAHEEEISAINTYDTVLSKTDESTDAKLMEMINEIKKDEEDHKTLLQHYIETGEVWTDEDLEKEDEENVEVEESKECIKEELPKQAPLDSLLDMVTEATNITELEEIADSVLDSELKEDLLECIDDEDAKAYGEDIYFNTVKLNMQNIIEDYMDEK